MTKEFIDKLNYIREKSQQTDVKYSIFTVLHKKYDERRLHSRFIASLLNPKGSHMQGDRFLRMFLNMVDLQDFDLNSINFYPREDEKKEWKDIDIYINSGKKAIIIENKIFAGDSNKRMEDEQEKAQLLNYYDKVKDDLNLDNIQAAKNIKLIYLTLNGKNPSLAYQFDNLNINLTLIDYIRFIPNWLNNCIVDLPKSSLRDSISQYLHLVKSITNDFELTMQLRELIVEHIQETFNAINLSLTERDDDINFLQNEFRHVKWHTVHEFWHDLAASLIKNLGATKINNPEDDLITTITHKRVKRNLILDFDYKGKLVYIANDAKGFTWGIIFLEDRNNDVETLNDFQFNIEGHKAWKDFENLNNIVFSDFSNWNTFELIRIEERTKVIDIIVSAISKTLNQIP